jgi:hypothetical protein
MPIVIPTPVRAALVLVLLVAAVLLLPTAPWLSAFALGAGALQVWSHLRYGTVWLAWRAARRHDAATARRRLGTIRRPALLAPSSRAYFHLLRGALALQAGDPTGARPDLEEVRLDRLRTDDDRCIALLALAESLALGGDPTAARGAFDGARALPHRAALGPEIERVGSLIGS